MDKRKLYIPIWYNSSQRAFTSAPFAKVLYIPIWYNSSSELPPFKVCLTYFTFQSGTIQAFRPVSNLSPIRLYIPIWYNSSSVSSRYRNLLKPLYIPIWYNSSSQCVIQYLLAPALHSNLVQFKHIFYTVFKCF